MNLIYKGSIIYGNDGELTPFDSVTMDQVNAAIQAAIGEIGQLLDAVNGEVA